jgi:hypothetical protein
MTCELSYTLTGHYKTGPPTKYKHHTNSDVSNIISETEDFLSIVTGYNTGCGKNGA